MSGYEDKKNLEEFKIVEAEHFEDSLRIFKEKFPLWLYNQVLIIADFYSKLDYDRSFDFKLDGLNFQMNEFDFSNF